MGYTEMVGGRLSGISSQELQEAWNKIENIPEIETPEKWKEIMEEIEEEYSCSSRFALMQLLYREIQKEEAGAAEMRYQVERPIGGLKDGHFWVDLGKTKENRVYFSEVSITHAEYMYLEEIRNYEKVLEQRASEKHYYESFHEKVTQKQERANKKQDSYLIAKAMKDPERADEIAWDLLPGKDQLDEKGAAAAMRTIRRESRKHLTREEALRLGHILGFSLENMEWFLLRVVDVEEGFRFQMSGDMIEAYGFLTQASWNRVEKLKKEYEKLSASIPKTQEDWDDGRTHQMEDTLHEAIKTWTGSAEERDAAFLEWMCKYASWLDRPSRTAIRLYRELACYFYRMIKEPEGKDREAFVSDLYDIIDGTGYREETKTLLFSSEDMCDKISDVLQKKNAMLQFSSAQNKGLSWGTVSTNAIGTPSMVTAQEDGINNNRVYRLLLGERQVEKRDLLYLLWFGYNLFWEKHPLLPEDLDMKEKDVRNFNDNLSDFIDTAEALLEAAMLPKFYPPHFLERTMLLAIIDSCKNGSGIPAYSYMDICEYVRGSRNKKKQMEAEEK